MKSLIVFISRLISWLFLCRQHKEPGANSIHVFPAIYHIEAESKCCHFPAVIFKCIFFNAFLERIFTEFFSYGSTWQQVSIDLGNSLAPNRRQLVSFANDDRVHRRIFAPQDINVITCILKKFFLNPSYDEIQFKNMKNKFKWSASIYI